MYLQEFLVVALVHLLAVASPGPDLAVVLRNSVSFHRQAGLATAAGVGTGILLHAGYSLAGIGLILSQSPMLFNLLKGAAALYLMYLGVRALSARASNLSQEPSHGPALSTSRAYLSGFVTNGLNPKATLFFLSLFTVVIDPTTPLPIKAGYGLYLALATTFWFCLVAVFFSRPGVRGTLMRSGHWFDRVMGVVLLGLGLQLALTEGLRQLQ
jgi:RhtB (resistance to homoserine/threonine) family protein